MRVCLLLALCFAASLAAPGRSNLQLGNNDADEQLFVEEVVVESVLHVKSAPTSRQGRTEARTSLQDGARVAEAKPSRN